MKLFKRWTLYAAVVTAGTVALLLGGLIATPVASAQEITPPSEDFVVPGAQGIAGGPFGLHPCGDWTVFDATADALGLTAEELFGELHAGKSLDEIAEEQGVDLSTVEDAVRAAREDAMRSRIQEALENGDISQEEADWLLEGIEQGFMGGGRGMRGMRRRPSAGPGAFGSGVAGSQSKFLGKAVPSETSL